MAEEKFSWAAVFIILLALFQLTLAQQEGDIRLSDGYHNEGRLEVYHNGAWGTVCSIMGPSTGATRDKLCQFLGFPDGSSGYDQHGDHFGLPQNAMNIELDLGALGCPDDATSILDCGPLDWGHTFCSHYEDFILRCHDPTAQEDPGEPGDVRLVGGDNASEGRVEKYEDGAWRSQCSRSTMTYEAANGFCQDAGFQLAVTYWRYSPWGPGQGASNVQDCSHTRDFSVRCSDEAATAQDGDIRLADGSSEKEGRVEVFFGHWGPLCSNNIYVHQAEILCSKLGFNDVSKYYRQSPFGGGSGSVFQVSVECPSNSSSDDNCQLNNLGTNCHHSDALGLECGGAETGTEKEFRLVNGSDADEGRVEIFLQGEWGSVCGAFSLQSADMICRTLGYDGAVWYHENAFFGYGSGPVWVANLDCPGDAAKYEDCSADPAPQSCTHTHDTSVRCGTPEVGEEMDMRLIGGDNDAQGRVEVYHNNEWGTVCSAMFGMNEANIVCQYLGFTGASAYYHGNYFGAGHNRVWMQGLECVEGGAELSDCQWSWEPIYCLGDLDQNAGVACKT